LFAHWILVYSEEFNTEDTEGRDREGKEKVRFGERLEEETQRGGEPKKKKLKPQEEETPRADLEIGGPVETQEHSQEWLCHDEKRDSSRKKKRARAKRDSSLRGLRSG
jgi:hypothetical protein